MDSTIVIIAEHFEGKLKPVTFELMTFALKLRQFKPATIQVIILGKNILDLARQTARDSGLDVMAIQVPELAGYNGEIYRNLLEKHLGDLSPTYVCVAHSSQGLDFAPALALRLNAACITGVEDVFLEDESVCFSRPVYGGKFVSHIRPTADISLLTIQPGIFEPMEANSPVAGTLKVKTIPCLPRRSRSLGVKPSEADISGITEADVIIAAGRGIGTQDNLELIHQLADLFSKAAVAGSRIVCDMGWLEYRRQVGVTGATVAPRLYIACGISGAVQHVMGRRGSGFIVAINNDSAAAIFKQSDICIVEDLRSFIPAFIKEYEKFKNER